MFECPSCQCVCGSAKWIEEKLFLIYMSEMDLWDLFSLNVASLVAAAAGSY